MIYYDFAWYGERIVPVPFISVVISTLLAFFYLMIRHFVEKTPIKITKEFRVILIFFPVLQLSILGLYFNGPTDEKLTQFFKTDAHLLFYIVFVFVIIQLFNKSSLQKFLKFYYVCGILIACFGILQFIHLNLINISGMDQMLFGTTKLYGKGPTRVASIFSEPSWFSYYLIDWIGIGLVHSLIRGWRKELIAVILLLLALFFSASLGGYVGLSLFIFLVLYQFPQIRLKLCVITIIILISIITWKFSSLFFIESMGSRIIDVIAGNDPSMQMRLDSAQAALHVWLRNPIIGVGIGNASFYTPEFYKAAWLYFTKDALFHIACDNALLTILAENGLIGFIAFIMMILAIIRQPRPGGFLNSILYKKSVVKETDINSSNQIILIYEKIFRIIVMVSFIQLSFSGAFLYPRLWFIIGVYLALKEAVREKSIDSPSPLFSEIHGSR